MSIRTLFAQVRLLSASSPDFWGGAQSGHSRNTERISIGPRALIAVDLPASIPRAPLVHHPTGMVPDLKRRHSQQGSRMSPHACSPSARIEPVGTFFSRFNHTTAIPRTMPDALTGARSSADPPDRGGPSTSPAALRLPVPHCPLRIALHPPIPMRYPAARVKSRLDSSWAGADTGRRREC
jgi:hypothetical protein